MPDYIKHHKIGKCSKCGWTEEIVRMVREVGESKDEIKPLCDKCRRSIPKIIVCDICGVRKESMLYPTVIEYKNFIVDRTNYICSLKIHLCISCKAIPHVELREKITFPYEKCESCSYKFLCYSNKSKLNNSVFRSGLEVLRSCRTCAIRFFRAKATVGNYKAGETYPCLAMIAKDDATPCKLWVKK